MSATLALLALDLPEAEIAALARLLGPAERVRASRYRFARDAARFIARRGQARLLLGEAMGIAPDHLSIEHDAFERPYVAGGPAFSLASAGAVGLCTISQHGPIGCDIERHDVRLADRAIARRLFAPGEQTALASLPADQWVEGFFECWTRKEAVVKALGTGLQHPLDSFEVSTAPGGGKALLASFAGLRLHAFDTVPGFSIAVCASAEEGVGALDWFGTQAHDVAAIRANPARSFATDTGETRSVPVSFFV
jgi:4'-phosphopantetheinyl transferase